MYWKNRFKLVCQYELRLNLTTTVLPMMIKLLPMISPGTFGFLGSILVVTWTRPGPGQICWSIRTGHRPRTYGLGSGSDSLHCISLYTYTIHILRQLKPNSVVPNSPICTRGRTKRGNQIEILFFWQSCGSGISDDIL